jgi:hypothetical protein
MEKNLDVTQQRVLYAKLGETITDPKALSKWRKDPKKYHEEQKQNKPQTAKEPAYDEDMFNEMMRRWDRQPEIQMQSVFADLVQQAQKGFRATLTMSQVTFALGILVVAVTFVVEVAYLLDLFPGVVWQQALAGGGVLGGLGIGTIVSVFVRGPSRQIQNAIGDLAQVEIAFLSFIDQTRGLDISSAKSVEETERLITLVSKLRRETMADIQKYLEKPDASVDDSKQ